MYQYNMVRVYAITKEQTIGKSEETGNQAGRYDNYDKNSRDNKDDDSSIAHGDEVSNGGSVRGAGELFLKGKTRNDG